MKAVTACKSVLNDCQYDMHAPSVNECHVNFLALPNGPHNVGPTGL